MHSPSRRLDRTTALFLGLHIVIMFAGFSILGPAFDFPEVLRYPAAERFALFSANSDVIRPTYWALTMTGLTQILLSVLLHQLLQPHAPTRALLLLVFGTLAGLCQALGFGRWVILIPWLVSEAADPDKAAMAAMLEGAFNHYAGMLVGEHIANLCWAVWLAATSLILRKMPGLSAGFGWCGLVLSALMLLLAGEQIGVSGDVLDVLVAFGFPLLGAWHILLAIMLWRRNDAASFPGMGAYVASIGVLLFAGMTVPAIL
ncbi:hypothetical protein NBRC116588_15610 [Pyruvatibacter sp. HU-CL02332]|uniref:DUF4386 family protein n=1 Tax=Pyruvatibacter sp. HU-CL02332 TaxID=3127650 RepID=UPI00310981CE